MATQIPEFDFILVGEVKEGEVKSENVKVISKVLHKDLIELYKNVDIGIGTLALHRKSMNEASPLKVSEYVFFWPAGHYNLL